MKERKRETELWPQGGNLWEMQVVWLRQPQGPLKGFRRWTDSFLINEGALTLDPLSSLRVEGYSAISFDWKREPAAPELLEAFLLMRSWGKGGRWPEEGKEKMGSKSAGSWTWDLKGFAGRASGGRLKTDKVSDALPGLTFYLLFIENFSAS